MISVSSLTQWIRPADGIDMPEPEIQLPEINNETTNESVEGPLARLRGFEGYANRKSFKINPIT